MDASKHRAMEAAAARPKVSLNRIDESRLSIQIQRDEHGDPSKPERSQVGALLLDALKGFFYVTSSTEMVRAVLNDLEKIVVDRGTVLMKQGEAGDKM